jgi:addiction module HigA family antidote
MAKLIENPHPGIILKEEFLDELGLSINKLAEAIGVPVNRIHHIVKGRRGISADTDLRLSRYFGLSEGFWLRLQNQYDLLEAKRKKSTIAEIKPFE